MFHWGYSSPQCPSNYGDTANSAEHPSSQSAPRMDGSNNRTDGHVPEDFGSERWPHTEACAEEGICTQEVKVLELATATTPPGNVSSGTAVLELALALDSTTRPSQASVCDESRDPVTTSNDVGSTTKCGNWPETLSDSEQQAGFVPMAQPRVHWPAGGMPKNRRRPMQFGVERTANKASRAAAQLRQLLDFYFEPFNLQHNRYLLDLIARRIGAPAKAGPWPAQRLLEDFRFSFDDLCGLGRIAAALAKLRLTQGEAIGSLKHLRWTSDGKLQLASPPEVRALVGAEGASVEAVASASRYLAAVREERGAAPRGIVSILSYVLNARLTDSSPEDQQRQAQLKRQLLLHHTDLICLQGFFAEGSGIDIAQSLVQENYGYAWSRDENGDCNTVFWDRSRLEYQDHQKHGASIAVNVRPLEDPDVVLRVACLQAEVPTTSHGSGPAMLLSCSKHDSARIIACVDATLLGGAECTSIVEELADLSSVAPHVLGEELLTPLSVPADWNHTWPIAPENDNTVFPVRALASGMNRLHRPDAMFFSGLAPILALSGHSEHYLATLPETDVVRQFPAYRVPMVAAFNWRHPKAAPSSEPHQCNRQAQ